MYSDKYVLKHLTSGPVMAQGRHWRRYGKQVDYNFFFLRLLHAVQPQFVETMILANILTLLHRETTVLAVRGQCSRKLLPHARVERVL